MTSTEKKMIEKNLDLIFEFEKYVSQIPREAVTERKRRLGASGDH